MQGEVCDQRGFSQKEDYSEIFISNEIDINQSSTEYSCIGGSSFQAIECENGVFVWCP